MANRIKQSEFEWYSFLVRACRITYVHEHAKKKLCTHLLVDPSSDKFMLDNQPTCLHPVLSVIIIGVEHPFRATNPHNALCLHDLRDMGEAARNFNCYDFIEVIDHIAVVDIIA